MLASAPRYLKLVNVLRLLIVATPAAVTPKKKKKKKLQNLTSKKNAYNLVGRWPHAMHCPNAGAADLHSSRWYNSCTS